MQSTSFDFGNSKKPLPAFVLHEKIIEDRGSRYSVSYGKVAGKDDIKQFLRELKTKKSMPPLHTIRGLHVSRTREQSLIPKMMMVKLEQGWLFYG